MAIGCHTVFSTAHDTLFVDDERRAHDPHLPDPVLLFFLPHAIGVTQSAIDVCEQGETDTELVDEMPVAGTVVLADAKHDGVSGIEPVYLTGKLVGLDSTSGRIVLRLEIEHDVLAAGEICQ